MKLISRSLYRLLVGLHCFAWCVHGLTAATVLDNFAEVEIATGLDPTSMTVAPDGRLFVCEKYGAVRIIEDGELLEEPFLSLEVNNDNERGLQSLAFDPDFENNGYVYVYYTTAGPEVRNRVSRFSEDYHTVVPGSEHVLLETEVLGDSGVHNGGAMHFRDDLLYIATGDGGDGAKSQDLGSKLGKILRIDRNGEVPPSNPFVDTAGADPTVWAYGLRNPFTFAFDPVTGKMFINDVGAASWEEINEGKAGANYGWPASEGPTDDPGVESPFYAYTHNMGCAITGAAFYNPVFAEFPEEFKGRYFFSDYCAGTIWTIAPDDPEDLQVFATDVDRCIDITVAPDGSIYYLARGGIGGGSVEDNTASDEGRVFRVSYTGSRAPSISVSPQDSLHPVGETAQFSVSASGSEPFSYQWLQDEVAIEGATSRELEYGPVTLEDDGVAFTCEVTNEFGSTTTEPAILSVTENTRPTPVILTPEPDAQYRAGEEIHFSGEANDEEDGELPASAFTWEIVFHHDNHTHPAMGQTHGIREGSYSVSTTGETSANVWYRVYLTVVDSGGLSETTYRDIHPRKVQLDFSTIPSGLPIQLDGALRDTPLSIEGVTGVERAFSVPDPLIFENEAFRFEGWSDGGDAQRHIATPEEDRSFVATFSAAPSAMGSGLRGAYYADFHADQDSFEREPDRVRVDPVVDFDWEFGGPHPDIGDDFFGILWTGQIQAPYSGTYTFYTRTDDGVRLWVNDELLIDHWFPQAARTWSANIGLERGSRYNIRMEYFEDQGEASASLLWSGPIFSQEVIPTERLFPDIRELRLETLDAIADEPSGEGGLWRIYRSEPHDDALEVAYSLKGSAVPEEDYELSPGYDGVVTIPEGESFIDITLTPLAHSLIRGRREAVLSLDGVFGWALDPNAFSGLIEIRDLPENEWRVEAFGGIANANDPRAADHADWDGDGLLNLLEYALGTNPTEADPSAYLQLAVETFADERYLTLTFVRPRPAPERLRYIVESSGSLHADSWSEVGVLDGYPQDNGDGTETVKARDAVEFVEDEPRFLRLRVEWE